MRVSAQVNMTFTFFIRPHNLQEFNASVKLFHTQQESV
jgi:hypothetical protein